MIRLVNNTQTKRDIGEYVKTLIDEIPELGEVSLRLRKPELIKMVNDTIGAYNFRQRSGVSSPADDFDDDFVRRGPRPQLEDEREPLGSAPPNTDPDEGPVKPATPDEVVVLPEDPIFIPGPTRSKMPPNAGVSGVKVALTIVFFLALFTLLLNLIF